MRNNTSSFGALSDYPTQVYPPSLPLALDFLSLEVEVRILFTFSSVSVILVLFNMASEFSVSSDYNSIPF